LTYLSIENAAREFIRYPEENTPHSRKQRCPQRRPIFFQRKLSQTIFSEIQVPPTPETASPQPLGRRTRRGSPPAATPHPGGHPREQHSPPHLHRTLPTAQGSGKVDNRIPSSPSRPCPPPPPCGRDRTTGEPLDQLTFPQSNGSSCFSLEKVTSSRVVVATLVQEGHNRRALPPKEVMGISPSITHTVASAPSLDLLSDKSKH